MSPDPIGADRNTYRYAGGDPVNGKDPSGLCTEVTNEDGSPSGVWDCEFFDSALVEAGTGPGGGGGGNCDFSCQQYLLSLGGLGNPNSTQVQRCVLLGDCNSGDAGDGGTGTGTGTGAGPGIGAVAAVAAAGCALVSPCGDIVDAAVLANPKSTRFERTVAGISLGVNAVSGGVLPNLGPLLKFEKIRTTGRAGEAAVRAQHAIGPTTQIKVNGRTRFPDGLTGDTLSEVKNVASLSYTRQLRDYSQFATQTQTGLRFDLYVPGPQTHLSGPLIDAISAGTINLRYIYPRP